MCLVCVIIRSMCGNHHLFTHLYIIFFQIELNVNIIWLNVIFCWKKKPKMLSMTINIWCWLFLFFVLFNFNTFSHEHYNTSWLYCIIHLYICEWFHKKKDEETIFCLWIFLHYLCKRHLLLFLDEFLFVLYKIIGHTIHFFFSIYLLVCECVLLMKLKEKLMWKNWVIFIM